MVKKGKQKPKSAKNKKNINKSQKKKTNKKEKKVTKEIIKIEKIIKEKEKEENKEEDREKLLEKINKVKYLNVNVGNDDGNSVEVFTEKGEKLDPFDHRAPLKFCNFHFTVDVDTGQILDWSNEKLYAEVYVRAIDTGSYDYFDKDDNKIYEESGYVPNFLGITSPAYGDDICFNTDVNGFILDWKEKNIKEQIIKHLREELLDENNL